MIENGGLTNGRYQYGAVYLPNEDNIYAVAGRDSTATLMTSVEILSTVPNGFQRYGTGTAGSGGVPGLSSTGTASLGSPVTVDISGGLARAPAGLLLGAGLGSRISFPVLGGTLLVLPVLSVNPSVAKRVIAHAA